MTNINQYYNPEQGPMVISSVGSKKFPKKLNSFSDLLTAIYTSASNDKFAIDSSWEAERIYYANYDTGYVRKIQYDGTEIATIELTNPLCLSIIQNASRMSRTVNDPPQEDKGCWIADKGTGNVVKTDNLLNITATLSGISSPVSIIADMDEGCFVAENNTNSIIKVSSAGVQVNSYVLPDEPKDMALDINGNLWVVCADKRIYNLYVSNNVIRKRRSFSPFSNEFSSSSSSLEENDEIGAIDVDRHSTGQYLYVTGGDSNYGWIQKYDSDANLIASNKYLDIAFPYVLKVVQAYTSTSLYILSDTSKWDQYGYGSSSSSSSIDSSSSSSSS